MVEQLSFLTNIFLFISPSVGSQASICSEPTNLVPFQLSIDHSLPEETVTKDDQVTIIVNDNADQSLRNDNEIEAESKAIAARRPNTLLVNSHGNDSIYSERKHLKHLYRSNSSSLHKRSPKLISPTSITANDKYKLSRELDRIYFISSNKDDENYDSIEVIDERRRKNMPKSEHSRLYKSNTFICEEYYSGSKPASADETERMSPTAAVQSEQEDKRGSDKGMH